MKKIALAAAAVSILFAGAASAADMAPRYAKAPPPPVVVWTWTGFYIGGNVGYSWNSSDVSTAVLNDGNYFPGCGAPCTNAVGFAASPGLRPDAFVGGLQAGYNWQANNFVVGVETDINSFRNRASSTVTQLYPGFPFGFTTTSNISTDWLFTLRGRLGVAATPGLLLYATGGLAVSDLRYSHQFSDTQAGFLATQAAAVSETRAGWTVGAGIEGKIAQNWTAKVEYLYVDLGSVSTTGRLVTINPLFGGETFNHSANLRSNIVRVGVNYLFSPAAVVAKY